LKHTRYRLLRIGPGHASGTCDGASLEAFPARNASIEHCIDATAQAVFEGDQRSNPPELIGSETILSCIVRILARFELENERAQHVSFWIMAIQQQWEIDLANAAI
jgi:hypothetical protein